jgi:hypothetical protein
MTLSKMIRKNAINYIGLCVMACIVAGCGRKDDIKVYRVSKETVAPQPAAESGGGMPALPGMTSEPGAPAGTGPVLTSTPPAGWESQPPSSMRLASFIVKGDNGASADISLVILGGAAGGGLDNVNRWLSQIGRPAINADQLAQLAKHVPSMLGDVLLVDLEGLPAGGDPAKDGRIVGGIISGEGKTIFFKMRGNAALAEAQKENFIQWIASVRMEEPGAAVQP